jgi:hypothetical protein
MRDTDSPIPYFPVPVEVVSMLLEVSDILSSIEQASGDCGRSSVAHDSRRKLSPRGPQVFGENREHGGPVTIEH